MASNSNGMRLLTAEEISSVTGGAITTSKTVLSKQIACVLSIGSNNHVSVTQVAIISVG